MSIAHIQQRQFAISRVPQADYATCNRKEHFGAAELRGVAGKG